VVITGAVMKCHNSMESGIEVKFVMKLLETAEDQLCLVHTADMDKTRLSCLIRICGVK